MRLESMSWTCKRQTSPRRKEELTAFFAALRKPKYRALFTTCYAAGAFPTALARRCLLLLNGFGPWRSPTLNADDGFFVPVGPTSDPVMPRPHAEGLAAGPS